MCTTASQYGSVIDFIEVHIFSYHWPDFNVADSAIVTGACLLLLDSLLPKREPTPRNCLLNKPHRQNWALLYCQ